MNQLSTPELDNVHPGTELCPLLQMSDIRHGFYKDDGKGCAVISDKISKP